MEVSAADNTYCTVLHVAVSWGGMTPPSPPMARVSLPQRLGSLRARGSSRPRWWGCGRVGALLPSAGRARAEAGLVSYK